MAKKTFLRKIAGGTGTTRRVVPKLNIRQVMPQGTNQGVGNKAPLQRPMPKLGKKATLGVMSDREFKMMKQKRLQRKMYRK